MALHAIISAAVIWLIFMMSPKTFAGDTDTARNYLSTIISCLSTIFTLCISITLVAIQLTATRYTHRVLDLFLKLPFNISLAVVYFVTIFQSLFLLSRITEPIHETLPAYLQPQMNADLALVVLCFVILIVYMYAVMRLLKPERIVAEIQSEFQSACAHGKEDEALIKVEQICDIAKRAAGDMDSTTGMITIMALQKMADDGTPKTRTSVIKQFIEIAAISAKEREGGMLGSVLDGLLNIGKEAISDDRIQDARDTVHAFERIVRAGLIGQQLFHFIEEAVSYIYDLATMAIHVDAATFNQQEFTFSERTFHAVEKIGEEVLARETEGGTYVARVMLSDRFGNLLRNLVTKAPNYESWQLLLLYAKLARLLIVKAELRDLFPITTWLRQETKEAHPDQLLRVTLLLTVLLAAVSRHANREDIEELIVGAMATRHGWPKTAVEELKRQQRLLRPIFNYEEPCGYIDGVYRTWMAKRAQTEIKMIYNTHCAFSGY